MAELTTLRAKGLAKAVILAYLAAGLVYSVAGYIHRGIIGRQEVFSPLLGIPMDVIGWPQMVYADLKHIGSIGFKAQPLLALIAMVTLAGIFVRRSRS